MVDTVWPSVRRRPRGGTRRPGVAGRQGGGLAEHNGRAAPGVDNTPARHTAPTRHSRPHPHAQDSLAVYLLVASPVVQRGGLDDTSNKNTLLRSTTSWPAV
ncbi:hypothetical protein E2C01_006639 [Portunus trituberculatus]|uniref:Uncharacterized protein n=1 Tax=Portunus trituberculatus TaxID=210409 RepID=A0A5B7CWW2_PORTR|nr:hypothetical protein [Portunus trituberculatus]